MAWYDYVNPVPIYNKPWMAAHKPFTWALGKATGYGSDKMANTEKGRQLGAGISKAAGDLGIGPKTGDSVSNPKSVKEAMAQRSPWTNQTGKQWYDLLDQQRAAAYGQTPSLAEAQYRQASGDTQAALRGAAAGTNRPGMMRASLQQQANVGQGMASGLAQAGLQERMANQQAYMDGLKGAGMVEGRDQSAWIQLAQILNGKPADPSTWDRIAAMAPLIAMMA